MQSFNLKIPFCILIAALILTACQQSENNLPEETSKITADLVIQNARIWTADPSTPWASTLAVKGEKIIAIGGSQDVAHLIDETTQVIESPPGMVVPGFIDTHTHYLFSGMGLSSVQLRDAKTPQEFTDRIAAFAKTQQPGEWIIAGDWDHENWGGELPTRDWIDTVTPDNPVLVNRLDGHMVLANSLALTAAGIDKFTAEVEGGEIVRDADNRPTGILKDNAMNLAYQVMPKPSDAQLAAAFDAANRYVLSHGVTSVHDMGDWQSFYLYRQMQQKPSPRPRMYSVVPLKDWQKLAEEVAKHGAGDHWLKIGGLKGFMDGSLGSHTAVFFEPYTDTPDDKGFFINSLADMQDWVKQADAQGLQVMVHAIGDHANKAILDIFADTIKANGERDRRFRIEHAQHIHPADFERFAPLNVIASMQPYHAIDDGRWAEKVIGGERIKTTYAFKTLLDANAVIAFGSDWSVAPAIPLMGIYAAVTRQTLDNKNPEGWVAAEKITVEQALTAYTRNAAYASKEEDIKGSLSVGKLADIVILDKDLTQIEASQIAKVNVVKTIVGGKTVYEQSKATK